MSNGDAREPLRKLEERLAQARRARDGDGPPTAPGNPASFQAALGMAWRIGIELVVAIVVSTGLGWAIDRWLGTRPWAMIVLFFLGVGAGMLNVWRAVTGMSGGVGFKRPDGGAAHHGAPDEWDEDE